LVRGADGTEMRIGRVTDVEGGGGERTGRGVQKVRVNEEGGWTAPREGGDRSNKRENNK